MGGRKMESKNNKLIQARAQLALTSMFFASILLRIPYKEDDSCLTMYTDGTVIGYNKKFIESLVIEELRSVLCHEVLHIVFQHDLILGRGTNKDQFIWNMATDYVINLVLKDAGFKLPQDCLFDIKYNRKSAETVYNELIKDKDKHKSIFSLGITDPGKCGEVRPNPAKSESEKKFAEQDRKIVVQQAASIAKKQGCLSSNLERIICELTEPKIPWREVLSRFLVENSKNDYSWKIPNRKYLNQDLYLPSLSNPELGEVILAVDTSGSISNQDLNEIATEIQSILSMFNKEFEVIYCDAKVVGKETIDPYSQLKLNPKGGGGTDYRPVFVDIVDKNIICLIYFTDGYCNDFPKTEPAFSTLWILNSENESFKPPFGEVILKGRREKWL